MWKLFLYLINLAKYIIILLYSVKVSLNVITGYVAD